MFSKVIFIILRVAAAQNVDFLGLDVDFLHVRTRVRFLHRFLTEKVTKMTPKWRSKTLGAAPLFEALARRGATDAPKCTQVLPEAPKMRPNPPRDPKSDLKMHPK